MWCWRFVILQGKHESRGRSRGRRRGKIDDDKRARSGSAKRRYDWNSSHFFPDIHDDDDGYDTRAPLTPRQSRYYDFVEEEWVRDQMTSHQQPQQQQQPLPQHQQQQGTFDESLTSHSGLYSEPHHTNTVNYTIATDSERRANAPSDSVTMATDYKKAQTVSTTSVTIYPAVSQSVVNSSTCSTDKTSPIDEFTSRDGFTPGGGVKSATLVNIVVSK